MDNSLYVDTDTKQWLVKIKPKHLSMVGFINAMAAVWNEATPEQQIKAINATKKENK